MNIFQRFRKQRQQKELVEKEKVIDLSDKTQYPASVLSDLNHTFALGDDSENMLSFLHGKWLRPKFHWGWDDITHEEAVGSDFLQRAFYSLNTQYRERRDAMIASEGYRFVWKNKDEEPVPGILTGEQLCVFMNRSLERDLKSCKSINAYEDRDARRWLLNPTFEDLMADWEKSDDEADYYRRDMGCGMLRFSNRSYGNKQIFIVNPAIKKVYPISEPNGKLVGFTLDDIDWDNVNQLEHNYDAKRLVADYGGLSISDYKDGLAYVSWMLYPDGRYFADEDGFGMEDNDEVNIGAYIDTECRVVVKFQDLEDEEKRRKLREEALNALNHVSRELPNSIGGKDEYYGATAGILKFYPEDIAKMKDMSENERIEFKSQLLERKRYYKPNRHSNVVSSENDIFQVGGGGYVTFYPEDIEKMKTMTIKERCEYKSYLLKHKRYYNDEKNAVMNVYEKKSLEFIAKIDEIVRDKSQEKIDSLFSVLDSLSLRPGYRLGLKLAGEVGIGDESWFYTYQGENPIDSFSCRVPQSRILFKDVIVEQSVMGAWQAYLLYISPTILPTFWHGGYIRREFFFDRENYKGITSHWANENGHVDIKLSQIPQPTVKMEDGQAVVSCPYWNDWGGLILETVDVKFNPDGIVSLTSHAEVLYEYNCGICY